MRISPALLAVLGAAALSACGGSGSTTSGPTSSASSSGGTATGTVKTVTSTATATATGAGTASTVTAASGTPTSSGPPACRAAGLGISFLAQQGATGHGELGFALRNTGTSSCSTIGYPGVEFLGRSGAPLPTDPTHTTRDFFGATPLLPLVVGPGQRVSFRLGVTHGIGSSAGCTTAYGLQVIPPNDTATLRVTIPDGAAECGTTTVSPLRSGEAAYP